MSNTVKWLAILALGAVGGVAQASTDSKATTGDYVRHALLAAVPAVIGLKTTLEKSMGVEGK